MIDKIITLDKKVAFIFPKLYPHKGINQCMKCIAGLGDFGMIWIGLSLLLSLNQQSRDASQLVLWALLLATIFGQVTIKTFVKRLRPCQEYPEIKILVPVPSDHSFPSGHTTSSFACATIVCYFYPWLGIVCILFAGLMAFSRIYLFVHYLSDVVFGTVLGIVVSMLILLMV